MFVQSLVWPGINIADKHRYYSYTVFRRVKNYYCDDPSGMSEEGEDAFDMRKPCSRDKNLIYWRKEGGENFLVNPEDVY